MLCSNESHLPSVSVNTYYVMEIAIYANWTTDNPVFLQNYSLAPGFFCFLVHRTDKFSFFTVNKYANSLARQIRGDSFVDFGENASRSNGQDNELDVPSHSGVVCAGSEIRHLDQFIRWQTRQYVAKFAVLVHD